MTLAASIVRNHSGAEVTPAHFFLSAQVSGVDAAEWARCRFEWLIHGGSEHDGKHTGAQLGLVWQVPGVYRVELTVEDAAGNTATASETIQVDALPTWDDEIHVAPTGDDTTGDGSSGTPYRTLGRAITALESGKASDRDRRILLERGGTYTETAGLTLSGYVGSFYVMAYGEGAKPQVNLDGATSADGLVVTSGDSGRACRWRFLDVAFECDQSQANGRAIRLRAAADQTNPRGHDVVLARCSVDHTEQVSTVGLLEITNVPQDPLTASTAGLLSNYGNVGLIDCSLRGYGFALFAVHAQFLTVQGGLMSGTHGASGRAVGQVVRLASGAYSSFRGVTLERAAASSHLLEAHGQGFGDTTNPKKPQQDLTLENCILIASSAVALGLKPSDGNDLDAETKRLQVLNCFAYRDATHPPAGDTAQLYDVEGHGIAVAGNRMHKIRPGRAMVRRYLQTRGGHTLTTRNGDALAAR